MNSRQHRRNKSRAATRKSRSGLFWKALGGAIAILIIVEVITFLHRRPRKPNPVQHASVAATQSLPTSVDRLAGFQLFFHREGCKATCPQYAILAKGDGSLQYVGVRNVTKRGTVHGTITKRQLNALLKQVESVSFFQIKPRYSLASHACKAKELHAPVFVIAVQLNGVQHKVRVNTGCSNVPPKLKQMASHIDQIVMTSRWTGKQPQP